jgi:tetratricopeptide (TPR) repeat protein
MNEAVELDPTFLRAWGELFINYVHGRWKSGDARTQMRLIAKKLDELKPNSAEAHFAKAWLAHLDFKSAEAEKEFLRAIRIDPSRPYAHSLYAAFLTNLGRLQEARKQLRECDDLDAGFWLVPDLLGDCFFKERNYSAAVAQYEKALSFAHQNIGAYERLGRLYEATHQIMDAIDAFQKARTYGGEGAEKVTQRYNELRQAFQEEGEQGYWSKRLEQAKAELSPEKQPYAFAVLQARLGHKDQALALLEKGWQVKDFDLGHLIRDQCWDDLRDNEGFKDLLKKMGYRSDWPVK